jgi:hypothetical protein
MLPFPFGIAKIRGELILPNGFLKIIDCNMTMSKMQQLSYFRRLK